MRESQEASENNLRFLSSRLKIMPNFPLSMCDIPSLPKCQTSIASVFLPRLRYGAMSTSSKNEPVGVGPRFSPPSKTASLPLIQSQYFVSAAIFAFAVGSSPTLKSFLNAAQRFGASMPSAFGAIYFACCAKAAAVANANASAADIFIVIFPNAIFIQIERVLYMLLSADFRSHELGSEYLGYCNFHSRRCEKKMRCEQKIGSRKVPEPIFCMPRASASVNCRRALSYTPHCRLRAELRPSRRTEYRRCR